MTIETPAPQILELRRVSASADGLELSPVRPTFAARAVKAVRERLLLVAVVILPMMLATVYYMLIASDMYETEVRFVVRSASGSGGLGSITSVVPTSTFSRANDDTHSVNAYIVSRDAVERLVVENDLLAKLAPPGADFLSRFPRPFERASRERLMERFMDFVTVSFDSATGISSLHVRAFRAADAQQLAMALAQHSEELINRLNERARNDAIRFATDVVQKAELRVTLAQRQIAEFRKVELVFDPGKQSTATLELMNAMTSELAQVKATLLEATAVAPSSPQIAALKGRIKAFEQQIEEQRLLIAGGDNALAPKLARYEQLTLERELAIKSLTSALLSLESARQEAQRQQLYLERIVAPALPDQARYPRRLLSLFAALFVLYCLYATLKWLHDVVMEHEA